MSKKVVLLLLALGGVLTAVRVTAVAQPPSPAMMRITAVDDSAFPTVRLHLLTLAAGGAPIADLTNLSLRENGIPIAYERATAMSGLDLVFVVDANATMLDVDDDDSGQTRWQKVQAGLSRFATDYMDANGQDRVSIIVPEDGGANGRFLSQNETAPTAVAAAIQSQPPLLVSPTPLNAMMNQAMDHLAGQMADGRFQAILLLTDAGQIHLQLPFDEIVQKAQAGYLPIFVAILGARADEDELFRANRLAEPTWASVSHTPQPDSLTPIFDLWAQHREQVQVVYQSLQRQSGEYPLALNIGEMRAAITWELVLLPPHIVLPPLDTIIRRGDAFDTPLADLQPARQTLPVTITWPDGKARRLPVVAWTVNGRLQPALASLTPDAAGQLWLDWDLQMVGEGVYAHEVQVTDELGLMANSVPLSVRVVEERPFPPTATPAPTAPPMSATPAAPTAIPALMQDFPWLWFVLPGVLLLLLLVLLSRRRLKAPTRLEEPLLPETDKSPSPTPVLLVALLEPPAGRPTMLEGDNITMGRESSAADVVLDDPSVSRLHARIVRQNGRYWLYDEGSAGGTFHNYRPVGLAPQPLQDGDQIGLGRVQLRFRLRPASSLTDEAE